MRWRTRPMEDAYAFCNRIPATFLLVSTDGYLAGFTAEEATGQDQVKASVQLKIRLSIANEYPDLEPLLEDMLPKKAPLIVAKCQNHINLVVMNNVPLFLCGMALTCQLCGFSTNIEES